jgi:rod shape-determining protein MreB
MLRFFVRKVLRRPSVFAGPRVVVCVPSGITGVEQRAVSESAYAAGARRVHIIAEPMAAAIGAGLPVNQPSGSMVIDIGGGTTEVAILALGGIVASASLRVAGNALDEAIADHVRSEFGLLIGERTAEQLKIAVGSAFPVAGVRRAEIRGREIGTGLPRNVTVASDELRKAMDAPIARIVAAVKGTLDRCPPELAGDLVSSGAVLTGGGALLRGLDARLQHELGIPVLVAERPLDSVVLGTGTVVEHFAQLHKVVVDGRRR